MYLTEVSSRTKLKTGVLHLFGLVNRFLVGKANWKVLHLVQNIKRGVLMNQRIKQTLFQMLILAPRASWGPEHKDQEALGTKALKS